MNIAIPVWEGKVSPVFDTASRVMVLNLENQKETSRFEAYIDEHDLTRRCLRIRRLGVDILICGAVSRTFYGILTAAGIHVIPWVSGYAEDVLAAYLNGTLFDSRFLMPGCRRKPVTAGKPDFKSKK